jgi:hypothetical protein
VNWTKYNKFLRNAFSFLLILIVYGAIIVYFGIFKNISFDGGVVLDIGAFTIISFLGVRSLRWDTTQRAFIDENTSNEELIEVNTKISEANKNIENDDLGNQFVDEHNEEKQKLANKKLTKQLIYKHHKKIRKLKVKGKHSWWFQLLNKNYTVEQHIQDLENKINALKKNEEFDKSFRPIKYDNLVSIGDTVIKKQMSETEQIDYDPRKDAWWSWAFAMLKFVGVAGTAIPFNLNNLDWSILIPFYIALTITAVITVVRRYISIRKKTATIYLHTRKTKLKLMKKCIDYIEDKETKERIRKNEEDTHKSQILKTDEDVVFSMDGNAYMVHRKDFINPIETPSLYGYGENYLDAYQDMQRNKQREDKYLEIIRNIDLYFKENNDPYELRLNKDLFNKNFIITRIKNYNVKYIAYVKQSNEYFYEIRKEINNDKHQHIARPKTSSVRKNERRNRSIPQTNIKINN